jgi:GTP cyclohydrolase FolE2
MTVGELIELLDDVKNKEADVAIDIQWTGLQYIVPAQTIKDEQDVVFIVGRKGE